MTYYLTFGVLLGFSALGALVRAVDAPAHRFVNGIVFAYSAVALVGIAGTRAHTVDRDYLNYANAFECFSHEYDGCRMEPAFALIVKLSSSVGWGIEGLMLIFAAVAVSIYAVLIARSETPYLSLLTYFATMFLLHEMTQIRAGLAIAIVLWGFDYLYRDERRKFIFCCLVATTAHISSLAFITLAFLSAKRHNPYLGLLLLAAAVLSSFRNVLEPLYDLLFSYLLGSESRYVYYATQEFGQINRFEVIKSAVIAVYVVAAFGATRIAPYVPKIYIYLNAMLIGLCIHYVFFYLPGVPYRLLDVFGSVLIFLLPATIFLARTPEWRVVASLGVVAFCVLHLFFYVDVAELVQRYRSIAF